MLVSTQQQDTSQGRVTTLCRRLAYMAENRIETVNTPNTDTISAIYIPVATFLPSKDDFKQLKDRMTVMVERVVSKYLRKYVPSNEDKVLCRGEMSCLVSATVVIVVFIAYKQVVIDNELRIQRVESGFVGRTNDAKSFALMSEISVNGQLPIPLHCFFLFGDCIYASRHPLITPFTSAQIYSYRRPIARRRSLRHFKSVVRRYRVYAVQSMLLELSTDIIGIL
ncbi:unnamed protein product [Mytilus coruscus]|uniref:Uncharacterized protein n=1 Tax=Mytilus coruscus TaxID=42192 RepID=A0A6J8EA61_MYTCO|nr:unnamed protein product [Mytilus coruscus]